MPPCRLCNGPFHQFCAHITLHPEYVPLCKDHSDQWDMLAQAFWGMGWILGSWNTDDLWWAEMNGFSIT